jgi:hypothetical protein
VLTWYLRSEQSDQRCQLQVKQQQQQMRDLLLAYWHGANFQHELSGASEVRRLWQGLHWNAV